MTRSEFAQQFDRLAKVYGAQHYPDERLLLIWSQVQSFGVDWLRRTVDHLIGSMRHPPLLPDFSEAIAIEREKHWERQKQRDQEIVKRNTNWSGLEDYIRTMLLDGKRIEHPDFQMLSRIYSTERIQSIIDRELEKVGA